MIVIKIKGGLGNQLFEYAFGRYLSLKTGRKLKFDISYYARKNNYRKFELDKFNIKFDGFIGLKENVFFKGAYYFPNFFKQIYYFKEGKDEYNLEKMASKKACYVDGYWQSEQYFKEIECELREELILKKAFYSVDDVILQKILTTNSVGIHIRRGDYITIPLNKPYRVCTLDYYQNALKLIKQKVSNPYCFVFSDDIEWVKKNIFFDLPFEYVQANSDYLDLQLMSLCKHNIMANSTFSWWGSWLNNNLEKIVIAPIVWRTDEIRKELYTDYQIRI